MYYIYIYVCVFDTYSLYILREDVSFSADRPFKAMATGNLRRKNPSAHAEPFTS